MIDHTHLDTALRAITRTIFCHALAGADGRLLGGLRKKAYLKDFR
jgi:hypothetical protein